VQLGIRHNLEYSIWATCHYFSTQQNNVCTSEFDTFCSCEFKRFCLLSPELKQAERDDNTEKKTVTSKNYFYLLPLFNGIAKLRCQNNKLFSCLNRTLGWCAPRNLSITAQSIWREIWLKRNWKDFFSIKIRNFKLWKCLNYYISGFQRGDIFWIVTLLNWKAFVFFFPVSERHRWAVVG